MMYEREKFESNEMDAMIQALGEAIQKSESRNGMLNVEKVDWIRRDYFLIRKMAQMTEAKVTWALHSPFVSMGYITLEADDLIFTEMKELAEVISRCDNLEIYPLTNGKIRMTLGYHGLVKFFK